MKILLVTPEYPPFHIGGGGIVVQSIAQTLSTKGHNVTVFSGHHPTHSFFKRVAQTYDRKLRIFRFPLIPTPTISLHLKTVLPPNIFSFLYLLRILSRSNFDAVHLHGFGHFFIDLVALLCRIRSKPYTLTLHGFPRSPLKAGRIVRLLYSLYVLTVGRSTLSKACRVTAISSAVKEEATVYGIDENRSVVIPNGLDLAKYKQIKNSMEFRKKYGIGLNDHLIVAVGILHERKGFQYLIEALPLIKNWRKNVKLLIVGRDGGYAKKLKELTRLLRVEDDVIFTDFLKFEMKLTALSETDIFVIPSLVEPFGLVALEAMAMGKPIVATRVGGLKSILKNKKTAVLVHSQNDKLLAEAITQLLKNTDLQRKLSENSRKAVTKYSWDRVVDNYLGIYNEIAQRV